MPRATLIIDADTSALRRSMGEIPGITQRAQAAATGAARKGGGDRVRADRAFERDHESISRQLARAREKHAKEETAKVKEEGRKQVQADGEFAQLKDGISQRIAAAKAKRERDVTRATEAEGRRQVRLDGQFAREKDRIHQRLTAARVAREKSAQREVEQLQRARRQQGREVAGNAASVVGAIATNAHGQIQNARGTIADRTSAINTSLVQRTGVSNAENAQDNAAIQARLAQSRTGVAPEVAIQAIASAQSFASALGGDTRAQRIANRDATLDDVDFAGSVDPQNISGIVNMGAVLRRRVSDPALRQRILRGAVGTSFEGSVETDDMIGAALPGLLQAISAGTANATSDAQREQLTAEIAQDFFAQIQSQAAGGRATGVSAHRTITVRQALANDSRQDRLGLGLAELGRSGTAEQRAAYASAFTKDAAGQYHMSAALRDTPSNAARFFGTMFNNDSEALHNALGVHGLGGNTQLLNTPDVDAIGSYFGMTTNRAGNSIREYDHVDELKTATVSAADAETMRSTRAAEDRTRIIQEQERRLAALRPAGAIVRASDAVERAQNENPLSAQGATEAGKWAGGSAITAIAGRAVMMLGAGPAALMTALGVAGTGLGLYGDHREVASGVRADGSRVGTGERIAKGAAGAVAETFFSPIALVTVLRDLSTILGRLQSTPLTAVIDPHDAAQVRSGAIPGARRAGET